MTVDRFGILRTALLFNLLCAVGFFVFLGSRRPLPAPLAAADPDPGPPSEPVAPAPAMGTDNKVRWLEGQVLDLRRRVEVLEELK